MDNHSDLSDPSHHVIHRDPHDEFNTGDFLTDHISIVTRRAGSKAVIQRISGIFYVMAALLLIRDITIPYAQNELTLFLCTKAITEACLFIWLGLYARKRPYPAILAGLVLFIAFSALSFFFGPGEGLRALVVRIVLALLLAGNIPEARKIGLTSQADMQKPKEPQ